MSFKDFVNEVSYSSRFNKLKEVINQPTRDRIYILTDFLEENNIVDTYVADYLRFLCKEQNSGGKPTHPAVIEITNANVPCKYREEDNILGTYRLNSSTTRSYKNDKDVCLGFIFYIEKVNEKLFTFNCIVDFFTIGENDDKSICHYSVRESSIDIFMNKIPKFFDKEYVFNWLMIQFLSNKRIEIMSKPEA